MKAFSVPLFHFSNQNCPNRRKAADERDSAPNSDQDATGSSGDTSTKKEHHQFDVAALAEYNGIFAQAFHQLHDVDPLQLRSNHQSWNVTFVGESGIDVGGVFRFVDENDNYKMLLRLTCLFLQRFVDRDL